MFPRDIVCRRNISINTLHKGDDNDNNNNNNNKINFLSNQSLYSSTEAKKKLVVLQAVYIFRWRGAEMLVYEYLLLLTQAENAARGYIAEFYVII